jgi:hypothetical protein
MRVRGFTGELIGSGADLGDERPARPRTNDAERRIASSCHTVASSTYLTHVCTTNGHGIGHDTAQLLTNLRQDLLEGASSRYSEGRLLLMGFVFADIVCHACSYTLVIHLVIVVICLSPSWAHSVISLDYPSEASNTHPHLQGMPDVMGPLHRTGPIGRCYVQVKRNARCTIQRWLPDTRSRLPGSLDGSLMRSISSNSGKAFNAVTAMPNTLSANTDVTRTYSLATAARMAVKRLTTPNRAA